MKSPGCDRQSLVLFACSALSPAEAERIRSHVQRCPRCREHLRQTVAVCESQSMASVDLPHAEASPRLYRRVAQEIRTKSHQLSSRGGRAHGVSWRSAFGLTGCIALLAIVLILFQNSPDSRQSSTTALPISPPAPKATPESHSSRLLHYRLALNRSPEALDEVLADDLRGEAVRPVPDSTIILRAGLVLADASRY